MSVLTGTIYRVQVEQALNTWVDVGDLERATYGMRGGTARRRTFNATHVRSQRKEYVLTLAGLINEADAGQAALIAAEETNTPIRVRWADNGGAAYQMMTVAVTSTSNEAPADDFETISYELASDAPAVPSP